MTLTTRHVVFDTETTGFRDARVVEVAAVEFHPETGDILRRFHTYVNPAPASVEPAARRVHGLSNHFLASQPKFAAIAAPLAAMLAGAACYAHNAPFDRRVLDAEFDRVDREPLTDMAARLVCTLEQAHLRLPKLGGRRLDDLCDHYGIDRSRRTQHGALTDCELLVEVIVRLRREGPRVKVPAPQIAPPAPAVRPPAALGAKHGTPWGEAEIAALLAGFAAGEGVETLAARHERSPLAIVLQLYRHGRLTPADVKRLAPSANLPH